MKYLIILSLTFMNLKTSGQEIKINITSNNKPIPFVTVSDSIKGILGYTDINGQIKLTSENYLLKFSHVSYEPIQFLSKKILLDTIINLKIVEKKELMEDVTVKSDKINKNKKFKAGFYNKKINSGLINRQKVLMGIKIENIDQNTNTVKFIRSVMFKLQNTDNIDKRDFTLEIKLYEITSDGDIFSVPINNRPIYINSKDLKKRNEILINERIKIPKNGILISVEFPQRFDDNYDWTLNFAGNFENDRPSVYNMRNFDGKWDNNVLKAKGLKIDDKYLSLNFGISYWKVY